MREVVFRVLAERPGHLEAKADTLSTARFACAYAATPVLPSAASDLWAALQPSAAELGCPVKGHGHHRLDHQLACAGRR